MKNFTETKWIPVKEPIHPTLWWLNPRFSFVLTFGSDKRTKCYSCEPPSNTLTFQQLLKKGLWFLCSSTLLPSEFWREVAPRILKACRVLLRSPKLQLLGTLLGLSSRLGSMLGDRRRTWTPPRLPGPPGTPGPTAGETPEPTVGTTGGRKEKNGTRCSQRQ